MPTDLVRSFPLENTSLAEPKGQTLLELGVIFKVAKSQQLSEGIFWKRGDSSWERATQEGDLRSRVAQQVSEIHSEQASPIQTVRSDLDGISEFQHSWVLVAFNVQTNFRRFWV